ncbi:CHAT domain protein [Ceratobasidium sp. AG-Ba]|nr:CHAT domain protein [Ceratobasidium sp. AG-Ba]
MPPRSNSNSPDQEAARAFQATLERHVEGNPECQSEMEWFMKLSKNVRRSRVLIDRKLSNGGLLLCQAFRHELAKVDAELSLQLLNPDKSPQDQPLYHPLGLSGQSINVDAATNPTETVQLKLGPETQSTLPELPSNISSPGEQRLTSDTVTHCVSPSADSDIFSLPSSTLSAEPLFSSNPDQASVTESTLFSVHSLDIEPILLSGPQPSTSREILEKSDELAKQFLEYGDVDDLDEAIELISQATGLLVSDPNELDASTYLNLGRMMRIKFKAYQDIADLDSAISEMLLKAHVMLTPAPLCDAQYEVLHELGMAFLDRFSFDGDEYAGKQARQYFDMALDLGIPRGRTHASVYCALSQLHLVYFEYFSKDSDAQAAVELLEEARELDATLANQLSYSEAAAKARFACYKTGLQEFTGYLDEALMLAQSTYDSTPKETIHHPIIATLLASLLLSQYERSGEALYLTDALAFLEAAIQVVPYTRPEQPLVSERLAQALQARFAQEGNREDLDDAIDFLKISASLTLANPHHRRARLSALSLAQSLRFGRYGEQEDKIAAANTMREAEKCNCGVVEI